MSFLVRMTSPRCDRQKKPEGTTVTFISISAEEFPGSLACALRVIDRKNGKACSQFTVYTDDFLALQEYVEAHNAGDSEFKVDLGSKAASAL
jgi:hypothetical protein